MRIISPIKILMPALGPILLIAFLTACGSSNRTLETIPSSPSDQTPSGQTESETAEPVTIEPVTTETITTGPAETPIQLIVAVMKLSTADNTYAPLQDGGELSSEDRYGIYFAPVGEEASIYVIQQDSTENPPAVLFPNPQYHPASNPVAADQAIWLPGGGISTWWEPDDVLDREKIVVVAIRDRNENLEEAILDLENPVDNSGLTPAEMDQLESIVKSQVDSLLNDTLLPGPVVKLDTKPVPISPDGQNVNVEALVLQGGPDAFNFQIEFQQK